MKAMVLAAGRGQRLSPLTDTTPKPLLEVGDRSLLERVLGRLEQAGFAEIVVNVSWHADQIIDWLRRRDGVPVQISHEDRGRLETGGGICQALPLLGSQAFAVVNADVLTDYPLQSLAARIGDWPAGRRAHLVLVPNPEHHPTGDFAVRDGALCNGGELTFSGLSVLHPSLFAGCQPGSSFPLAPLLREAAETGAASAERYAGYWNDVGTPGRLAAARRAVQGLP